MYQDQIISIYQVISRIPILWYNCYDRDSAVVRSALNISIITTELLSQQRSH